MGSKAWRVYQERQKRLRRLYCSFFFAGWFAGIGTVLLFGEKT